MNKSYRNSSFFRQLCSGAILGTIAFLGWATPIHAQPANGLYWIQSVGNPGLSLQGTGDPYLNASGQFVSGCNEVAVTPTSWNVYQQQWRVVSLGGGLYHIMNTSSGQLLQATGDPYHPHGGANVGGCDKAGLTPNSWNNAGQQWRISAAANGYSIASPSNSQYLQSTNDAYWSNLNNTYVGGCDQIACTPQSWGVSSQDQWNLVPATPSMLHTSGTNIVNANGSVVLLKGVNLGGLFVMEKWMTPLDSGSLPDTYSVIQELDNRFGVATEQSLISGYQANWITTADLDNIENGGYNCVRVPVWWGNFFTLSSYGTTSGWRSDAFTELDWLVSNCASRGIYVIIDMHGVVGGQSTSDDTGQQNQNTYWSNGSYQGDTAWMWWEIANHYKGNPTVAGYDLINEPDGAPSTAAVINAYNGLYSSVRSADPNHIIIMEGTFGSWNWSMLPNPSTYGWTNVAYEMHEYQYGGNAAQCEAGSDNQVNDFNNHKSWNVPAYIGEWNDMGNGAACYGYSINDYTNDGMSWTMWSYKVSAGLLPNGWGWYDPTHWPTTPNISSDSAATISSDWQQWQTTTSFGKNSSVGL